MKKQELEKCSTYEEFRMSELLFCDFEKYMKLSDASPVRPFLKEQLANLHPLGSDYLQFQAMCLVLRSSAIMMETGDFGRKT